MIEKELQWSIRLLVILLFGVVISCTQDANLVIATAPAINARATDKSSSQSNLPVYWSKAKHPVHFSDLGNLHSYNGDQAYSIAVHTNIKAYPFGLLHCKAYSHLVGCAVLQ
jgi:hypothetical protein